MHPFLLLAVGIAVVVGSILALKLHAFLALILAALVVSALTPRERLDQYLSTDKKASADLPKQSFGRRVADGFGKTCAGIGIVIAMAAIIGECLMRSGGADRIVSTAVGMLGVGGAPIAFAVTGFILGIPVFFDTVFYLMIPLARVLAARTGKDYGLYVMTIAAGATISHSLVPPTPGPLLVAEKLDVMGEMILGGIIIGGLAVIPGVIYAYWNSRRWPIPVRDAAPSEPRDPKSLPPLWLAMIPIFLPVVLIVADAVLGAAWSGAVKAGTLSPSQSTLLSLLKPLGDPNIALALAALVSIAMLLKYRKERTPVAPSMEAAIASAGAIILITSAGGAFGEALKQTAIAPAIESMFSKGSAGMSVLVGAFLVTGLIRVAQGSATVAMGTAIGMFAGLSTPEKLGFHPVYVALAIGFGSKLLPWMNDSGFWVVCKMSGQTVGETLRNHSVMFTIMGVAGLLLTIAAALLFPFAGAP